MDNRKVIVSYKKGEIDNYMNENQNQCLICFDNQDLIIIKNEYCKCYVNMVICKSCFIKWIINYYNCFICRKKFITDEKYRFSLFNIVDIDIYRSIINKLERLYISIPIDDRVIERTNISVRNNNDIISSLLNYIILSSSIVFLIGVSYIYLRP